MVVVVVVASVKFLFLSIRTFYDLSSRALNGQLNKTTATTECDGKRTREHWSTRLHLLSRMQVDSLIKSLRSVISFYDFSSFSIIRFYSSSICWHHYWQCRINIYTYIYAYMYSHIKPSQEEKNKREKQTEMNGHKRITNFCILMLNQMS